MAVVDEIVVVVIVSVVVVAVALLQAHSSKHFDHSPVFLGQIPPPLLYWLSYSTHLEMRYPFVVPLEGLQHFPVSSLLHVVVTFSSVRLFGCKKTCVFVSHPPCATATAGVSSKSSRSSGRWRSSMVRIMLVMMGCSWRIPLVRKW